MSLFAAVPGALAQVTSTVTLSSGNLATTTWNTTDIYTALGAVALVLAGLFLVVKIIRTIFALIV